HADLFAVSAICRSYTHLPALHSFPTRRSSDLLSGMPRRIYTYPASMGWGGLNLVASVGAAVIALSLLIYMVNVVLALRAGVPAGDRKSTRLNSSHQIISYAVFCLKKKKNVV